MCGICVEVWSVGVCVCVSHGGEGVVVCLVGWGYLFYVTTDFIFLFSSIV